MSVAGYTYSYNDANQRTRVNLTDGSFWVYDYDSLGQVKSGKRYWNDWTPVAGQQFEYGFDDIGNRNSTKTGGDSAGANLRSASYTNNTLNQITGRDVPSYLNVIGAASATATNVNVNNTMAYRRGEYYQAELNPNNTSAAVWQSVTNRVVQNGTTNSVTGNLFLPKHAETFSYDADGNLTNDGRWAYVWDGDNRLLSMTSHPFSPASSSNALHFRYDAQGRRISKTVSNYSGSSWSKVLDEKYLYDGWNQLTSLNASNSAVVRAFLWGTDLSGSMQGAGGVGGLLAVNAKGSGVAFVAYDGNGNVAALIDAALGNTVANYDYGPFGEVIRASGTLSKLNPFRFSTKFQDDETGLLYYGYRFYDPSAGRWLSRDPVEESGGLPLYAFCRNSGPNLIDHVGLTPASVVDGILRKEIQRVESDQSFLVHATHYPAYLRKLDRLLPRIKVVAWSGKQHTPPTYDANADTLTAPAQLVEIIHEMTHAYNDVALGLNPMWDDKKDEGIAWVVDNFPVISGNLIDLGAVASNGECNRSSIKKQWTLLWRKWGTFGGSWGSYTWQNPLGGTTQIGATQINDAYAATGVRLSCQALRTRVNSLLSGCCFRVVCDRSEKIGERDIEPSVSLDPVFR